MVDAALGLLVRGRAMVVTKGLLFSSTLRSIGVGVLQLKEVVMLQDANGRKTLLYTPQRYLRIPTENFFWCPYFKVIKLTI